MAANIKRVGIVGYGRLGQYLAKAVLDRPNELALAFVWNRSADAVRQDPSVRDFLLEDLNDASSRNPDLIVEVAHPVITKSHGALLLSIASVLFGSPTAFADAELEAEVRAVADSTSNTLWVPAGALWGALDIQKMADRGSLKGLTITMRKHPSSFKLNPPLDARLAEVTDASPETVLYQGPVRALCPLAPNNVNTMACAALAAHNLGFDHVQAVLTADPKLEAHVVEVNCIGPQDEGDVQPFSVKTVRYNPAKVGAVTGNATYASFLSSLLRAVAGGPGGLQFC